MASFLKRRRRLPPTRLMPLVSIWRQQLAETASNLQVLAIKAVTPSGTRRPSRRLRLLVSCSSFFRRLRKTPYAPKISL